MYTINETQDNDKEKINGYCFEHSAIISRLERTEEDIQRVVKAIDNFKGSLVTISATFLFQIVIIVMQFFLMYKK